MAITPRKINTKILQEALLKSFPNKRGHLRFGFEKEIEYALHDNSEQCFKGIIINISYSGLGLFVFAPLSEGQEITIISDDKTLNRRAIVCWSRSMGDNVYTVGLKFLFR